MLHAGAQAGNSNDRDGASCALAARATGSTRLGLIALFALAIFAGLTGRAAAAYEFTGTFSGPGSEVGQLDTPGRAAVEQSSGDLFVVDSGNDRVQVFRPNGFGTADYLTQLGAGELSEPWGIAIDENGGQTYVYVADAGHDRIVKYDSDGADVPTFAVDPSFSSPPHGGAGGVADFHAALAVDPTDHNLLVADPGSDEVERFEADGSAAGSFDGSAGAGSPGAFTGLLDLAVNTAGDVYVIDANGPDIGRQEGTSQALRYSASGEYKATLSPLGPRQRPAAVAVNPFDDSVVVSGDQDAVYENETPKLYGFKASNESSGEIQPDGAALYDAVAGLAVAVGPGADTLYAVLDQGHYFSESYGSPQIQALTQPHPAAPEVSLATPTTTESTAVLRGTVNPGNLATTYWFEYGVSSAYGSSVPVTQNAAAGSGGEAGAVSQQIFGLAAATTYHYRLVARNSLGTVASPDAEFTTGSGVLSSGPAGLPDGRAYELVSPGAEKRSGGVGDTLGGGPQFIQVAADGERVQYMSYAPFGDAGQGQAATGYSLAYLASRTAEGWRSTFVSNAPQPDASVQALTFYPRYIGASADLSTFFSDIEYYGTPGFTSGAWVNDSSGRASLIAARPEGATSNPRVVGASADGSVQVLLSEAPLTPIRGNPTLSGPLLYERVGGRLSLVDVDDEGSLLDPGGATLASYPGQVTTLPGAVSADGSRILFLSRQAGSAPDDPNQLYMRIDGERTVLVSASAHSAPAPALEEVQFAGAAADGSRVFFTTTGRLTDGATGAGPFLYRYDLPLGATGTGQLHLVAGVEHPVAISPEGTADSLASADGTHVYFVSPDDSGSVYEYDVASGRTELVADELGAVALVRGSIAGGPSAAEVTPDGRRLVFVASRAGLGQQVYLYDADDARLTRVSTGPEAPQGPYFAQTETREGPQAFPKLFQLDDNFVSDDGSYVFFQTNAPLVARDNNGVNDVYRWHNGDVALISAGGDRAGAYLSGASADGSSAFFMTTADLLPGLDGDDAWDVYSARVGGGFPEPAAPLACDGEACQGSGPRAPAAAAVGSLNRFGAGNLKAKPAKRCRVRHRSRHGARARPHKRQCGRRGEKRHRPSRTRQAGQDKKGGIR